jgi:hypothetical protein
MMFSEYKSIQSQFYSPTVTVLFLVTRWSVLSVFIILSSSIQMTLLSNSANIVIKKLILWGIRIFLRLAL